MKEQSATQNSGSPVGAVHLLSDRSQSSLGDDEFERGAFACHLARNLCLEPGAPSIVVGIEGEWGTGKTTCIDMIREILKQSQPEPIIVDYSPWLISTLDSVIEGFFVQLAAEIGASDHSGNAKETGKHLLAFSKMLAPIKLIPGVEPWGTMVERVLGAVGGAAESGADLAAMNLMRRKNMLQDQLAKLERPIIVIIDDIDRLPPDQIRLVFQLLKTLGDFQRVAYVIGYAPEPVEEALSYKGECDGKAFLEKIVQVAYPVPRFSFRHRYDYLKKHLAAVETDLQRKLSDAEEAWLNEAIDHTELVRAMESPRDIVRLSNHLRISARHTEGEVCFADLVVFEALNLKYPKIAEYIRKQPELFISDPLGNHELTTPEARKKGVMAIANAGRINQEKSPLELFFDDISASIKGFNASERVKAESLLSFLFPHLHNQSGSVRSLPELTTRVKYDHSLLKLLQCGITSLTFALRDVELFLSNPSSRKKLLDDYRSQDRLIAWLRYVIQHVDLLEVIEPEGLCDDLFHECKGSIPLKPGYGYDGTTATAGDLLHVMIMTGKGISNPVDLLRYVVRNKVSLSLSAISLHRIMQHYRIIANDRFSESVGKSNQIPVNGGMPTYSQIYEAKDLWLETIREVSASRDLLDTESSFLLTMHYWGKINQSYTPVQQYIGASSEDATWLAKFIELFNTDTCVGDLTDLVSDVESFRDRLLELPDNERAKHMANYLAKQEQ